MSQVHQEAGVVVLGAGLTGAGVALELARRGVEVLLVERDERPLNRASLRNEGKIHLGLIYANDGSLQTATTQLRGALQFHRLLTRWLGEGAERIARSTPFHYLVAKTSVLSPDELEAHYKRLGDAYAAMCDEDPSCDYLGERPAWLARRLSRPAWHPAYAPARCSAVFETAERAIDPTHLAREIQRAITAEPRITLWTGHEVTSLRDEGDAMHVTGRCGDSAWSVRAKTVVNALWENRLCFDAQMGLPMQADWLHRMKYRVISETPAPLRGAPSATIVIGRFGDIVVRPDDTIYLSWYPASLRGWAHGVNPPETWNGPCRGEVEDAVRAEIGEQIIAGLAAWFPAVRDCVPLVVDAGVIVAVGRTDVDDRASGLHDRSRVGVTSRGGYHSIEPGKLTTAPLFAREAAGRVAAQLGVAS